MVQWFDRHSDRMGAQPADKPVTPADLIATLLHLLGLRPGLQLYDRSGRPVRAGDGKLLQVFFS
ncbi:MAG TPA: hypothetical protein VH643_38530 [Gemmataceae bacterium]|jgi:hypothetical protein